MRRRIRSAALPLHRHSLPQLAVDGVLVALAYYLAFQLRFDNGPSGFYAELRERTIWWVLVGCLPVLVFMRVYQRRWRYSGQRDYEAVTRAIVVIVLLTVVAVVVLRPVQHATEHGTTTITLPNGVIVLFFLLSLLFLLGVRVLARTVYERRPLAAFRGGRKGDHSVLIVGAGDGGRLVLREIARNRELGLTPVGFLDDDPVKHRLRIDGVRVRGNTESDLPRILEEAEPDEVIIAIPSAPGSTRARVVRECRKRGIPVRTLPTVFELLQDHGTIARQVREVRVEDVLGREAVHMELDRVGAYLAGETVLDHRRRRLDRLGALAPDRARGAAPDRAARPRRGQPLLDPAGARGRAPRAAGRALGRARRLQGGGAHAGGVRRAPPDGRLPRGRLQARGADGGQPGRGRPQQRDRHQGRRACRRRAGGGALRAGVHRQGRGAGHRDGGVEGARRVRAGGGHRPLPRHPLCGGALRQRARLLGQRRADLPPPDRARRSGDRDRRAHDPLLHDDPRGGAADHPHRIARPREWSAARGPRRRGVRARHGRTGAHRRARPRDDRALRPRPRPRHRHRDRRPPRRGEAPRGAVQRLRASAHDARREDPAGRARAAGRRGRRVDVRRDRPARARG